MKTGITMAKSGGTGWSSKGFIGPPRRLPDWVNGPDQPHAIRWTDSNKSTDLLPPSRFFPGRSGFLPLPMSSPPPVSLHCCDHRRPPPPLEMGHRRLTKSVPFLATCPMSMVSEENVICLVFFAGRRGGILVNGITCFLDAPWVGWCQKRDA